MVAGPKAGAGSSLRRSGGCLGFRVNQRAMRCFNDRPMAKMRDLPVRLAVVVSGRLNVHRSMRFDGGRRILSDRGRADAGQCDYAQ